MKSILKVIGKDIRWHLSFSWPVYSFAIWFGGGCFLLHYFREGLAKAGLETSDGAEPIAMILLSIVLGIIVGIVYVITKYVRYLLREAKVYEDQRRSGSKTKRG